MGFKIEIVSPEKLFLTKNDIKEVVIPAYEGYMGILENHIPIISFLKPGILELHNSNNNKDIYYIEDGTIEFKDNCLTILTSKIYNIKDLKKSETDQILMDSEKELGKENIDDKQRYLINQKIDTLKSLSLN